MEVYSRGFIPIANWLIKKMKITTDDCDPQFWFGFHPHTHIILKQVLKIAIPG
jgi:hypothetical protein